VSLIKAKQLFDNYGEHLVNRRIVTNPAGSWPGGIATIVKVMPDPMAPDIIFQVVNEQGEIGVFDYELVELLPK